MGSRLSYKMPSVSRHSLHTLRAPLCSAVKVKVKVIEKAVRKKAHCLGTHISHGGHTTARHGTGDRSGYGSGFVTVTRHTSNHFPILLHQSAYSIHLFPPFVKSFFHTFPEKSGERGGAFCGALLDKNSTGTVLQCQCMKFAIRQTSVPRTPQELSKHIYCHVRKVNLWYFGCISANSLLTPRRWYRRRPGPSGHPRPRCTRTSRRSWGNGGSPGQWRSQS